MLFKIGTVIAFALIITMLMMMGLYYFVLIQHLLRISKKSKKPFNSTLSSDNKNISLNESEQSIQVAAT